LDQLAGFPGTVDHPDAGISPVAGLLVVMQAVLEGQMPVASKVSEESAMETGIWKWPLLWETAEVQASCTLMRPNRGQ
jgi:hypothetical protein